MDGIDSLKFNVILVDDAYKREIDECIKQAQRLNSSLSDALNTVKAKKFVTDAGVKNSEKLAAAFERIRDAMQRMPSGSALYGNADALNQTLQQVNANLERMVVKQSEVKQKTDETAEAQKKVDSAAKQTNTTFSNTSKLLSTITQLTGVYFGAMGVRRFISELAKATGEFEVQKMALTSMLQSAETADEIFKTLRKNALESPYTFQDLTKYAKQLTAFNIDADKLIETERRLADVAAGLGVDMGRIILAYGQVKAAGVLKGTELRQFTEAGVPLLQSLAEQIKETEGNAISLSEVFARISKKQIPFEMVEEAFRRMTDEGGKFYKMQEVLVNTLQGKISKLRDVWQQTLYDIGSANDTILKGAVDAITVLVSHLGDLGRLIPEVALAYGAFRATQAIVEAGSLSLAVANSKVVSTLKDIAKWVAANPYALIAAAVVVAGVEIYKFYKKAHEGQERLTSSMREFDKEMSNEIEGLDELKVRLEKAEKGTREWTEAKEDAVRKYGKYFDGLDAEIEKVGTLETAYDNLRVSIEEATRIRQGADFERKEKEIWETGNKNNLDSLSEYLYGHYSRPDAFVIMNEVQRAMRQNLSWNDLRELKVGGLGQASEGFWKALRSKNGATLAHAQREIAKILEDDKRFRKEYTENMRQVVKEYGLQGTAIDPDYRGPVKKIDENNPTTEPNKPTTPTWTPLKEELKGVKDEYDELAAAIDKDNEIIFKQTLDELDESIKQFDDYYKMMDKWERKDFNLWGETKVERDMAKIVSDYATKEAEIEERRKNALIEAKKAHHGNAEAIEHETDRINDLAKKEKAYEKILAQDKITGLADKFFKHYSDSIDLEALSTKSRAELDNLHTKISAAKDEAIAAIDEAAVELQAKGFNVDELKIEVTKDFDNADKKVSQAEETKNYAAWQRAAKAAAKAAGELADGLARLGEAAGNSKLTNIAEAIQGNANAMEGAIQGVREYGGWWGAIIGALEVVGKELLEDAAIWKEVEVAVERSKANVLIEKMEELLGNSSGSLGESWTLGLRDAVSVMEEMQKQSKGIRDALTDQEIVKTFNSSLLNPIPVETWLDNILYKYLDFNANIFSRVNGDYKAYQEALEKGYTGVESYILKTQDRSGFLNAIGFSDKYNNLKDVIEELGYDLYDEYGNLNAKGLQAILDTYTKLGAEDKAWMEKAIAYSEEYEKAVEKVKETVADLFGDISGELADNMIKAFKETGNAVDNLAEAFDDLGETFVRSMLESAIYETVLKKYEKDMQDLFTEYGNNDMDYTELMDRVDGIFNGMETDLEKAGDVWNAILSRADELNWLGEDVAESTSNSIGSGIKSITEDTANLLASYINAIRADVSSIRVMQESSWDGINLLGASVPTLNEHLAQIAASTFDTAQATQSVLSELRSVIGAPGSSTGMVVHVENY